MSERMRKRKTFADSELNCTSTGFMYAPSASSLATIIAPSTPQQSLATNRSVYCLTSMPMQMRTGFTNDLTHYHHQHPNHQFDYRGSSASPTTFNYFRLSGPNPSTGSPFVSFAPNQNPTTTSTNHLSPTTSITSCCSVSSDSPPAKIRLIDGARLLKSTSTKPKISFSIESIIGKSWGWIQSDGGLQNSM